LSKLKRDTLAWIVRHIHHHIDVIVPYLSFCYRKSSPDHEHSRHCAENKYISKFFCFWTISEKLSSFQNFESFSRKYSSAASYLFSILDIRFGANFGKLHVFCWIRFACPLYIGITDLGMSPKIPENTSGPGPIFGKFSGCHPYTEPWIYNELNVPTGKLREYLMVFFVLRPRVFFWVKMCLLGGNFFTRTKFAFLHQILIYQILKFK